jgi:hypothetical protein
MKNVTSLVETREGDVVNGRLVPRRKTAPVGKGERASRRAQGREGMKEPAERA